MRELLRHLFIPRESNNHRAGLLHNGSLLLTILLLVVSGFLLQVVNQSHAHVLGISANITTQDLLSLTNQKRQENGLAPLYLNEQLSHAAFEKAQNMFSNNYWAHNAPVGTTPWAFITDSGYEYIYAGENLARGFTASGEVVSAWMDSPGHRDNILSANYKDIGFAVVPGTLLGDETVLVVQMFGSAMASQHEKTVDTDQFTLRLPSPVQISPTIIPTSSAGSLPVVVEQITPSLTPTIALVITPVVAQTKNANANLFVASVKNEPLINSQSLTRQVSAIIAILFIFVLFFDMMIIKKRKVIRFVGHNLDHVIFLSIILAVLIMLGQGVIL